MQHQAIISAAVFLLCYADVLMLMQHHTQLLATCTVYCSDQHGRSRACMSSHM